MAERSVLVKIRYVLWALIIVLGVGASVIFGLQWAGVINPIERPVGLFGGQFELTSTQGETFTQDDLKGTPSLVFFGYTYCPDVCPTTLAEAVGWRQQLGLDPDKLRIIFVTVDPERDTADGLKQYLAAFDPDIIGLRGDEQQTEAAKKAFGVYSEKVNDSGSSEYLVNHTASVFLLDKDGSFQGTIDYGEDRDTALEKIRRLVMG